MIAVDKESFRLFYLSWNMIYKVLIGSYVEKYRGKPRLVYGSSAEDDITRIMAQPLWFLYIVEFSFPPDTEIRMSTSSP